MFYFKQTWLETVLSCWGPQFCTVHVITLCAQHCTTRDEDGWRPPKNQMAVVCPSVKMTIPILNHFELPFRSASPCRPCLYPGLYLSQAPPANQQVLSPRERTSRSGSQLQYDNLIQSPVSHVSHISAGKNVANCCLESIPTCATPQKSLTELVSSPKRQPCDAPLFRGAAVLSFLQRLHGWTIGKRCWNIDMSWYVNMYN